MKLYNCDCRHALFPFGNHLPICIREWEEKRTERPILKPCIEKGCKHYNPMTATTLIEKKEV